MGTYTDYNKKGNNYCSLQTTFLELRFSAKLGLAAIKLMSKARDRDVGREKLDYWYNVTLAIGGLSADREIIVSFVRES